MKGNAYISKEITLTGKYFSPLATLKGKYFHLFLKKESKAYYGLQLSSFEKNGGETPRVSNYLDRIV